MKFVRKQAGKAEMHVIHYHGTNKTSYLDTWPSFLSCLSVLCFCPSPHPISHSLIALPQLPCLIAKRCTVGERDVWCEWLEVAYKRAINDAAARMKREKLHVCLADHCRASATRVVRQWDALLIIKVRLDYVIILHRCLAWSRFHVKCASWLQASWREFPSVPIVPGLFVILMWMSVYNSNTQKFEKEGLT